ncbi:hypothetical protein C8J56DRAFT_472238 [Mycena floridula]|nr:hypothetical protein C8J56DRAFT_472238 [Mycena floridula]
MAGPNSLRKKPNNPRKKRKSAPVETDGDSDYHDDDDDVEAPKITKKTKGKLAGLLTLPLDIIFELLGHLAPLDLIRCTRTSKAFRNLLLMKNSVSVWKSCRANIPGLPGPPPGLSEPAWAYLVSEPHCHYCQTAVVHSIEWIFRKRICARCAPTRVMSEKQLFGPESVQEWHMVALLLSLVPTRVTKTEARNQQKIHFCLEDFETLKAAYALLTTDAERQAFVVEKKKIKDEIHEHASLCELWEESKLKNRESDIEQIKRDRAQAVEKRLEDLGYGEDLKSIRYPDSIIDHKLVKQARPLTDRGWKKIEAEMIVYMEGIKVKRLARERAALLNTRKCLAIASVRNYKNARLPYTDIMPDPAEYCDFPPIKAIIDLPSEKEVDESMFTDVLPQLPHLIELWRKSIKSQLAASSQPAKRAKKNNDDAAVVSGKPRFSEEELEKKCLRTLQLAAMTFTCQKCQPYVPSRKLHIGPLLTYPDVLVHPCTTSAQVWASLSDEERDDPSTKLDNVRRNRRVKWNCKTLKVDARLSVIVKHLISLAGLDPDRATVKEMDDLKKLFSCTHCAVKTQDTLAFQLYGWRAAVEHIVEKELFPVTGLHWVVFDDEDQDFLESADFQRDNRSLWLCVHCRDLPAEDKGEILDKVKTHLLEKHNVSLPEENRDFYMRYSTESDISVTHLTVSAPRSSFEEDGEDEEMMTTTAV